MDMFFPEHYTKKAFGRYKYSELKEASETGTILEAKVIKCDKELNLEIDLGYGMTGVIPYSEFEYKFNDRPTKPISVLSKVGKTVQFKVSELSRDNGNITCKLSRKAAQEDCYNNYISKLQVGQVINAKATFTESYGVFCDIGCGIIALLPIENLCTTRINDPKHNVGRLGNLKVIVKKIEDDKVTLSHKELLGTWDEEASKFEVGDTVPGIVRIIEDYGVFVELTPNLVGLAGVYPDIQCGDNVSVYIKSIYPDKMKVKLIILNKNDKNTSKVHFDYKIPESGMVKDWVYSPENCPKRIETHFGE